MVRDITMIFSVLVSILSLIFGIYKNVEAGNAKAFALKQAYQILGVVQQSGIGVSAKMQIVDAALERLAPPPPVIDLSSSNADAPAPAGACSDATKKACLTAAGRIASLNAVCAQSKIPTDACTRADALKEEIELLQCITCFNE
jgi:hypothetical protein